MPRVGRQTDRLGLAPRRCGIDWIVEREPNPHDDDPTPGPGPAGLRGRPVDVVDEVEHARAEVFRAYIRARERARELGEVERPEDHPQ
jgi:hypothetical protein